MEMTLDDVHERLGDLGYGPDDDLERRNYHLLPALPPLDHPEGGAAVASSSLGTEQISSWSTLSPGWSLVRRTTPTPTDACSCTPERP
jgi:hypothetical protein